MAAPISGANQNTQSCAGAPLPLKNATPVERAGLTDVLDTGMETRTEVTLLASVGLRLLATANERFVLATANKRFGESGGFAVVAGAASDNQADRADGSKRGLRPDLSLDDALAAMRSKHRLR